MANIINEVGLGASLGQSFGTGLSDALGTLANQKINKILKENHYKQYGDVFQKAGYNPGISQLLSHLAVDNPQGFHNILETLGAGQGATESNPQSNQSNQLDQSNPIAQNIAQAATSAPQETTFAQQFAKGIQSKKPTAEDKAERTELNKFLSKQQKKYEASEELGDLAEETLKYLKTNKKHLPSFPWNQLPTWIQNNKALSKLKSDYAKISGKVAAAEAAGTGFRSGKALLDLAQASKSAVDQPYETQEELLKDLIAERNKQRKIKKSMLDIKSKHGGKYPLGLEDMLTEAEFEGEGKGIQEGAQEEYQTRQSANGTTEVFDPATNKWRQIQVRGA